MSEEHWDRVYATKGCDDVSWYQAVPATSIRLVTAAITATAAPRRVIDIGAGASTLADELLARDYDVTVLDVAPSAVASVKARLGDRATYIVTDLLEWRPQTAYDVWHDRAVFHFLTDPIAQTVYVNLAARAVRAGGAVVMGTFAPDGPEACSGLPTSRHDAESLAALFADSFELVSSERDEHTTPWGALQPFTWVTLSRRP